jgi:saccharopine dehydrogenase (NAD+, L-lysine-forming)
MKIAVAGGAGLTGQCAVRDLLKRKNLERLVVADYDSNSLSQLKKKLGKDSRLEFKKVDVTQHDKLTTILKGCDVVVNGVQYYFNLDVMQAALKARVNYLDFGGLYHTTLKQIRKFDEKYRSNKILAVVGMGAQPGVSNLMVKHALTQLTTADTVEIFDGWRDLTQSTSPMYFTWSPLTFFDESEQEAIVFEKGRYEQKPPFSEPETISFPKPVGKVDVFLALHSELATLPRSFSSYGLKRLVWKEGGADFWKIKLLADLGLTSKKDLPIDGRKISIRRFFLKLLESKGMTRIPSNVVPDDFEITRVIAEGKSGSKKKRIIVDCYFPPYRPWKVSCSQYNVGIPGSIAAQLIASKEEIFSKGVLPAESVFDPLEFFAELSGRGIKVKTRAVDA